MSNFSVSSDGKSSQTNKKKVHTNYSNTAAFKKSDSFDEYLRRLCNGVKKESRSRLRQEENNANNGLKYSKQNKLIPSNNSINNNNNINKIESGSSTTDLVLMKPDVKTLEKNKIVEKFYKIKKENDRLANELKTEKSRSNHYYQKLKYIEGNHAIFERLKQAYLTMKYNEASTRALIEVHEFACQTDATEEPKRKRTYEYDYLPRGSGSCDIVVEPGYMAVKKKDYRKLFETIENIKDVINNQPLSSFVLSEKREAKYRRDIATLFQEKLNNKEIIVKKQKEIEMLKRQLDHHSRKSEKELNSLMKIIAKLHSKILAYENGADKSNSLDKIPLINEKEYKIINIIAEKYKLKFKKYSEKCESINSNNQPSLYKSENQSENVIDKNLSGVTTPKSLQKNKLLEKISNYSVSTENTCTPFSASTPFTPSTSFSPTPYSPSTPYSPNSPISLSSPTSNTASCSKVKYEAVMKGVKETFSKNLESIKNETISLAAAIHKNKITSESSSVNNSHEAYNSEIFVSKDFNDNNSSVINFDKESLQNNSLALQTIDSLINLKKISITNQSNRSVKKKREKTKEDKASGIKLQFSMSKQEINLCKSVASKISNNISSHNPSETFKSVTSATSHQLNIKNKSTSSLEQKLKTTQQTTEDKKQIKKVNYSSTTKESPSCSELTPRTFRSCNTPKTFRSESPTTYRSCSDLEEMQKPVISNITFESLLAGLSDFNT